MQAVAKQLACKVDHLTSNRLQIGVTGQKTQKTKQKNPKPNKPQNKRQPKTKKWKRIRADCPKNVVVPEAL